MHEFVMALVMRTRRHLSLFLLVAGIALAAATLAFVIYHVEVTAQSAVAFTELATTLDLKRESIRAWLWDRRSDGQHLKNTLRFGRDLEETIARGELPLDSALNGFLTRAISSYGYSAAYGIDPQGKALFETGDGTPVSRALSELAMRSIGSGDVVHSPLFEEHLADRSVTSLGVAAPLYVSLDAPPVGAVAMRIDADAYFLPLVWGLDSSLAISTRLVRRKGDSVLHWLRDTYKRGPVVTTDAMLASVQALEGPGRRILATDFRGVRVLAKSLPIEGSDWFLVATRDASHIEMPALTAALTAGGFFLFALGGGSFLAVIRWRYRQRTYEQNLRLERLERKALEKHFDWSTKYARDIVLMRDATMRIVQCNDAALAAYGYNEEELRALPPRGLRTPEQRATFDVDFRKTRQAGGVIFETQHRRKDGSVFPVEISARRFEIDGQQYYHSVVRDITGRKRQERLATLEHAVARRLARARRIEDGLRAVVRTICRSEGLIHGDYWEVDEAVGVLRYRVGWSTPGVDLGSYTVDSRSKVFAPGVGLVGRVWQSGEPLWSSDFGSDPRALQKDVAAGSGIRGTLVFPVLGERNVIGVLVFFSFDVREPDEQLLAAARAIGRQIGQFVLRGRAEEATRANESRFRMVTESAMDGIIVADHTGKITSWNPAAERLFQYTKADAVGQSLSVLMPTEYRARHEASLARLSAGGAPTMMGKRRELQGRRQDGTVFEVELSLATWGSGTDRYYSGIVRDLTERKTAELRINYLTRLYATLSQVNTAIVHSHGEEELFAWICNQVVEHGAMLGAVVRLADAEAKVLRPVAYSERVRSVAEVGDIDVDPKSVRFNHQIAPAFLEDRIAIHETFLVTDPQDAWQVAAYDAGIRSGALLPIRRHGKPIGLLALSASEPNFFDQEMRLLLDELTGDVAFALDHFEYERRREAAEMALRESEERFRGLVEQAIAGIYIIEGATFTYVNPRFAQLFGYKPEEMIDREYLIVVAEEFRDLVKGNVRKHLSGEIRSLQYKFTGLRKDGSRFTVGVHGTAAVVEGRSAIIGLAQDISEREEAQRQIDSYVQQLEESMLGTVHAVSAMVEMRDPYTAGHEERVGALARAIGAEMGLPEETMRGLEIIGSVHDIGKISVPAEILAKPTRLTALEYEIIKTHAQLGHDVFQKVQFPWPLAKTILQHHERVDGTGYPNGLKGEEILLEARIIAVADTVEAMGSHRPYRPGLGIESALDEIEKFRGVRYCERAVDACLRLFREKGYTLSI